MFNYFSGDKWFYRFYKLKITFDGTVICIVGFCIAIVEIIFLENERKRNIDKFDFINIVTNS